MRRLGRIVALALLPAIPIPEFTGGEGAPEFIGSPAEQRPVFSPDPPRHPFMAPNGRSNLHVDAYMTDVHQGPGPLGRDMQVTSTFLEGVCGSVTFDSEGKIVTVCVGLEGPKLVKLDPATLELLGIHPLPPRIPTGAAIFNDFAGGGYFYLDHEDRAVIPTTTRHIWVVGEDDGPLGFRLERDYDVSAEVPFPDKIISALPDWSGRIWFASVEGVVGTVDPESGEVRVHDTGEEIANSFSVDEDGGVYIVTAAALYRFDADEQGAPAVTWREEYPNSGIAKPGQVHAGSGTTPTVMGESHVAITDNADPMNVLVYQRARHPEGEREVCRHPVFDQGRSATDQSLIATRNSIVTENNYGYTGPTATNDGATTAPGLERIDLEPDGRGCSRVWRSEEIAPSVVPKLSAANGLVYTYTKPAGDEDDPWYLTAIDFHTGQTVWKRLAGTGLGFNNNFAPVTLGPDGSAYVGALGGLVALRDAEPPPQASAPAPQLRLSATRTRRGRMLLKVAGPDAALVESAAFGIQGRRTRHDRSAPFTLTVSKLDRRRVVRVEVRLADGRRATLRRTLTVTRTRR